MVVLRNVNLRSRPGRISDTTCITRRRDDILATEEGEDSAAGPLQRMYLAESGAEASAERSRRLATLTKNKTKRSVHRRSPESKKKTRKNSTVESMYWRFFTSQVFRLTLHVNYRCCAWSLEWHEASYACVLLVITCT